MGPQTYDACTKIKWSMCDDKKPKVFWLWKPQFACRLTQIRPNVAHDTVYEAQALQQHCISVVASQITSNLTVQQLV